MLIVRGGIVLTMEEERPVIENGAVVIEGTDIIEVGEVEPLTQKYPSARILGSQDDWVLPGFVNAHNHSDKVGSSFRSGIVDMPLERWLIRVYHTSLFEGHKRIAQLGRFVQIGEMIRSGITCSADFFYGDENDPYFGSENGLLAYKQSGMRVVLFITAIDKAALDNGDLQNYLPLMPPGLAKKVSALGKTSAGIQSNFLDGWRRVFEAFHDPNGMIRIAIAPDGPTRCTPEFLMSLKSTAQKLNTLLQIHVLETKYQRQYWHNTNGEPLIQSLHKLGFLGPEVSFAHCVWLTEKDMDLLSEAGTSIVHNPSANLRLCSGIAPLRLLIKHGINTAFGTDAMGFSDDNDFIEEIRLGALLQGIPGIESESFSGRTALAMATINGARALGLANLIGSLSPGKRADLVTISAKRMLSPLLNPIHSPEEIILRRARREDIRHVLINGQVVMDEVQITTFDPVTVEEELKACCNDIWKESKEREQCLMSTLNEVDPIVENFFRKYDDGSLQAGSVYNAR